MSFGRIFMALLALFLAFPPASQAGLRESLEEIARRAGEGRLSAQTASLYRLYALKAPEKLPQDLQSQGNDELHRGQDRCLTPHFMGVKREISRQAGRVPSEALRLAAERPAPSPKALASGTGQLQLGSRVVDHALTYYATSENFSFEWGATLTNEDGTSPATVSGQDHIPDVVKRWAAYFENALAVYRGMGFASHETLANYRIQVLIGNSDPTTSLENTSSGYYGLTYGDIPPIPGGPPAYIVVTNNFAPLVAISPNDENAKGQLAGIRGAMMSTAAHELHHVLQFLYAPQSWEEEWDSFEALRWWFEATSTWAEDEVYPFVNDYKQYFEGSYGWANYPYYTLAWPQTRQVNSSVSISRTYGAVIFAKYLAEHVGGQGLMAGIWDNISQNRSFEQAVEGAALSEGLALTFNDVFLGFSGANATMDYDEGAYFGTVPRSLQYMPEKWGSAYSDFTAFADTAVEFRLTSAAPASSWGVAAAKRVEEGGEEYGLVFHATGTSLSVTAEPGRDFTLAASYLGPASASTALATALQPGTVSDVTPPGEVAGLLLTPVPGGFSAQWQAAADDTAVGGYVLLWKEEGEAQWKGRTILAPATTALIRNLEGGETYLTKVFAYDKAGNLGPKTAQQEVAPGEPVDYPAINVALNYMDLPEPLITTQTLPQSTGYDYAFALEAGGGTPPYSWNVVEGALPPGFALNPATGILSGTPAQWGLYGFTVEVSDVNGLKASRSFTLTVQRPNTAPAALGLSLSLDEDQSLGILLSGGDEEGDALTFAVVSNPLHGTLSGQPPNLTYRPAADYYGGDSFRYAASDGLLDSEPAMVELTVLPVNDPPVLTAIPDRVAGEGTSIAFTVLAVDADSPQLSFSAQNMPAGASLNAATGQFTWTPSFTQAGVYEITFSASDSLLSDSEAVTITVLNVNRPPVFPNAALTMPMGMRASPALLPSDPDGQTGLVLFVTAQPSNGVAYVDGEGRAWYAPAAGFLGSDSFGVAVSDPQGETAAAQVSVTVQKGPSYKRTSLHSENALVQGVAGFLVGNFDGEAGEDLAAVGNGGELLLYRGQPQGGYGPPSVIPFTGQPLDFKAADLDGDNLPDLILLHTDLIFGKASPLIGESGGVTWVKNLGGGHFGEPESFFLAGAPTGLAVLKDAESEETLLLAAFGNNLAVFRTLPGFRPQREADITLAFAPSAVLAFDTDRDGREELLLAGEGGVSSLSFGVGWVAPALEEVTGVFGSPVGSGDFDEDGWPELLTFAGESGRAALYKTSEGGALSLYLETGELAGAQNFALGDLNGDGETDLGYGDEEGVVWLFGDGAGGFSGIERMEAGAKALGVANGYAGGEPGLIWLDGGGTLHAAAAKTAVVNFPSAASSGGGGGGGGCYLETLGSPEEPGGGRVLPLAAAFLLLAVASLKRRKA